MNTPESSLYNSLAQYAAAPAPEWEVELFNRMGGYANRAPTPEEQQVLGGYQTMTKQGFSPEELNAMKQSALEGANAQAESTRQAMLMNAKRTGNDAGLYGGMARAMQTGANAPASIIRDLEIANAQQKQQNIRTGLEGIGNYNQQLLNRQMAGTGQQIQMGQNVGQRQLQGWNQAANVAQNAAGRQQGYANMGLGFQNALRQNRQFGLTGLQNLYNTGIGQQSDLYSKIAALLGTRTGDTTNLKKNTTTVQGT